MTNSMIQLIKRINVVFFFMVVVLLIFLISSFILSLFLKDSEVEDMNNYERKNRYQYVQFKEDTKETSVGIATLRQTLGEEEFISYESGDNEYTLISHFNNQKYKCVGNCYCTEETRRMSSSIPLRKGLIYLVAGLSSVFAVNKARDHFSEECEVKLTGECPESAILSEVENCEAITKESGGAEKIEDRKKSGRGDDWNESYQCTGNCMTFPFYDENNGYFPLSHGELVPLIRGEQFTTEIRLQFLSLRKRSKLMNCDGLSHVVRYNPTNVLSDNIDIRSMKVYVQVKFMTEDLSMFCQSHTMYTPDPEDVIAPEPFDRLSELSGKTVDGVPMCVGFVNRYNPTITCVEYSKLDLPE